MNNTVKRLRAVIRSLTRKPRVRKLPLRVNYHENWLVPPAAFFVGIYLVLYSHHRSFGEAIFVPDFYRAAVPSVAVAWVMMRRIVKRTYHLDATYPWAITWWRGPLPRVVLQAWHGVVMPGFVILIFYAFYFTARGHSLRFWKYVGEDFYFVILMLWGFSVILWVYYRLRTLEIMAEFRQWRHDYGKTGEEMERRWQQGSIDVVPDLQKAVNTVALLGPYSKENNTSFCTYMDGKADKEPYTMKDFFEKHEGYHFHKPRPEIIVNRAAIREIYHVGKDVVFILDKGRPGEEITVSVRNRKAFLEWWEMEPQSGGAI